MMAQIGGCIEQWLATLFPIGIEEGDEFAGIVKCLILSYANIDALEMSNCR